MGRAPPNGPPRKPDDEGNECRGCGAEHDIGELDEETIDNGRYLGTEWKCPGCGSTIAADVEYVGPVPVRTHSGTEWH